MASSGKSKEEVRDGKNCSVGKFVWVHWTLSLIAFITFSILMEFNKVSFM